MRPNRNQEINEVRYPTILHRPAAAYVFYKEFFLICICILSLVFASMPQMGFRYVFLWIAGALTVILFYKAALLKSAKFQVTHDRIKYTYGLFGTTGEKIELYRVMDVTWHKPPLLRLFGYGHVTVHSTDKTRPVLLIPGIRNPEALMTIIADRAETNKMTKRVYEIANR